MEEVQRISALVHLAVRERRLREAQEAGTRQAEEMLRERENNAFRNAMGIHNQTVDSYLQAIVEKAGAGNAQEEVGSLITPTLFTNWPSKSLTGH